MTYIAQTWFWLVGNKPDQVFSAPAGAYVPLTDPGYQAFTAAGNQATPILCDGELADVLLKAGCAPSLIAAAGHAAWGSLPNADIAAVLVASGVELASTATPALNGAYAADDMAQNGIAAIYAGIKGGDGLPGGGETFSYRDMAGNAHSFAAGDFAAFAKAVRDWVYQIRLAAGEPSPSWPAAMITIP